MAKKLASGDYELDTTMMLKVLSRLDSGVGWVSDWLHQNVRNSPNKRKVIGIYVLEYRGQPGGSRTQHYWRVYTNDNREKERLDHAITSNNSVVTTRQVKNEKLTDDDFISDDSFAWNGLKLRSPAEQKIAEELEKRKILFFANARCRITNRSLSLRETKEVDFLIYYRGNSRILEVDGREYHPSAAKDHHRDRLFERQGVRCTRFTATECLNDPRNVIDEFLELFDVYQLSSNSEKSKEVSREEQIKTIDIDDIPL